MLVGFVAGLLVGCGAALVREEFDNRLRATPDLESLTDSPVLGTLPRDGEVEAGKVAVALVQSPQSQMAEAIRELRTSLRVALGDSPGAVVMVTSPEAGDGKTFVTANLGAALAMSGSKVVVVSADFRRPRLEAAFGFSVGAGPGLAEVIRANWKDPELDDGPRPRRRPAAIHPPGRSERQRERECDRGQRHRSRRGRPRTVPGASATWPVTSRGWGSSLLVETGIWGPPISSLPALAPSTIRASCSGPALG